MPIKITEKILSIPPYLSTSWSRVLAVYQKEEGLVIILMNGDSVQLAGLSPEVIQLIFLYHEAYLEKEGTAGEKTLAPDGMKEFMKSTEEPLVQMAFGTSIEGLGPVMQHNPDQKDAPNLPLEILEKVRAISKIITPKEESMMIPQAVDGCNCFYCQLARVIHPTEQTLLIIKEEKEEILDEELHFEQWSIIQTGEQLFSVSNKLDEHESYRVYLGQPVGCTCGKTGCEHILAVLKS